MKMRLFLWLALPAILSAPLHPAAAQDNAVSQAEILQRVTAHKRAVFRIFAAGPDSLCSGTGFLISPEGYIVTNRHVVKDATSITVYILAEDESSATGYTAECIQEDPDNDLAMLKLPTPPSQLPPHFTLAAQSAQVFDEVAAIGFPAALDRPISESADMSASRITDPGILENLDPNITKGAVSKVGSWVIHDAKIAAGNSGGPLIDLRSGEVVGVNTAKTMGKDAFYMAVPIEKVLELVNRMESAHAVTDRLEARIAEGDDEAKAELATRLYKGDNGYPPDPLRAIALLESAAEHGCEKALFELGCIYTEGKHVPQDDKKALSYLEQCSTTQAKVMMFSIYAYSTDEAYPRHPEQAFRCAESLYKEGEADGKMLLAECYRHGIGTKRNIPKAVELLREAVAQEKAAATPFADPAESTELRLAETLMESPSKGHTAEALELLDRIAQNKDSFWCGPACCTLSIMYFEGTKVKQDLGKHIHYLRLGAEAKHAYCIANLAIAYLVGNRGVEQDLERGRNLATESVERGGGEKIYYYVGSSYLKAGQEKIGMDYMMRALAAGSSMARNEVATWHLTGMYGFKRDKEKAIRYLKQSAQDREDALAVSVATNILKSIEQAPVRRSGSAPSARHKAKPAPALRIDPKRNAKPW